MTKTWQEGRDAHEHLMGPVGPTIRHELMQAEINELRARIAEIEGQEPVAWVRSKYGDPEAFGERELEALVDLSRVPYGTKFYAAAGASPQPSQETDWQDLYQKEKRRSEMWIAKYEKDIRPLEKAYPTEQPSQARELSDAEIEKLWIALSKDIAVGPPIKVYEFARAIIAAINAKEQAK